MLDDLVENQKDSTLEECEAPDPEPQERTMTVLKLTEGLTLKVASSCFEEVDSNEQVAATTRQGIMRIIFVT